MNFFFLGGGGGEGSIRCRGGIGTIKRMLSTLPLRGRRT